MGGNIVSGSWGRLPIEGPRRSIERDWRFEAIPPELDPGDSLLAYGRGRSYGDSCINSRGSHISTRRLNRFVSFDEDSGFLECEAGITLDEILDVIVPKGWFLPVVPGTRFVTLGGAIANDVHGKNHHSAGSFGCYICSLEVLRSDGSRTLCTRDKNSEIFAATIGGLGLTGLITKAEIQLKKIASDTMLTQNVPFSSIEHFVELSSESIQWDYSVAWVDTTASGANAGRGILARARHAIDETQLATPQNKRTLSVPFSPPFSLINNWTARCFNQVYYFLKAHKTNPFAQHYQPFFFPLDSVRGWNRIYGKQGFYQYQCVVPIEGGCVAVERLVGEIRQSGQGSFLTVLKVFGEKVSPGLLSFPRPGLTLAIDFPNRGGKTGSLFEKLDAIVLAVGGALYPAKDARMSKQMFLAGYPNVEKFAEQIDPQFSSAFWRRMQL
ncbi:MAG: FAD/FMN-containing dehydrogenase [Halioglobus sp.]